MAAILGWFAFALIAVSGLVPLFVHLRDKKRSAPESPPIRLHVILGVATSIAALVHAFAVLPSLGSEDAVEGGMIAFAPGVVAFFVLFAHVGIGLRLRDPKQKKRQRLRRIHQVTAVTIAVMASLHAAFLLRAAG